MRTRALAAALGLTVINGSVLALREVRAEYGARAKGVRAERMRNSPQFRDGAFRNVAPPVERTGASYREVIREMLFGDKKNQRYPTGPIPMVTRSPAEPATTGLHLTWYGHASVLVEIDGARVLFDPVWSERVSPLQFAGPHRLHEPPVALESLPKLDAILISHDHYDHLDMATVQTLARTQAAPFLVPLGIGAHLERWKVPADRIIELDWDEHAEVAGLRLTATPAQHFSGRTLTRNDTLWTSWVVAGPAHRVYYSGDSGYFDGYAKIGEEHGPFDAALIQIGAYDPAWPDIHMTPEEGVATHLDLRAELLVPVHWGTFNLAMHPWTEPADRVWDEAKAHDVKLAVPRPGERIDVDNPPTVDGWWQALGVAPQSQPSGPGQLR
ncbi:MBL fold metallo-hydrolase [Amycolatopsis sp.]|jgi:L-ascorbate metabolism protein UlaG (beta-lactamase superfamily)|uniref:MBL fold metallo-hydrolase n=1 Tax=Amycolatopsis sp. TaxID=37632 RepID=UPI002DF90D36|nr:MBL fold metallo-hydrolase [Amycolatopsis sp.]